MNLPFCQVLLIYEMIPEQTQIHLLDPDTIRLNLKLIALIGQKSPEDIYAWLTSFHGVYAGMVGTSEEQEEQHDNLAKFLETKTPIFDINNMSKIDLHGPTTVVHTGCML